MICSLLIINTRGEILIQRIYRSDVGRKDGHLFVQSIISSYELSDKPPVVQLKGSNSQFVFMITGDLIFVAVVRANPNAVLVLESLRRLNFVLNEFLGPLSEPVIRKNIYLIFSILDEVYDFGIPQVFDVEALRLLTSAPDSLAVQGERMKDNKPQNITIQTTGACTWRHEGIRYRRNDVYVDIIESVNALISQTGQVLRSDVVGQIIVKCQLSGMPECKFGLNDKIMGAVSSNNKNQPLTNSSQISPAALEDVRFHHCVKTGPDDSTEKRIKHIVFVPPDGTFQLMAYRISENVVLPFKVSPVVQLSSSTIQFSVKLKSTFPKSLFAANVVCLFPCPENTAKATIHSVNFGKGKLDPAKKVIVWSMKRFPGETEHTLSAEILLSSLWPLSGSASGDKDSKFFGENQEMGIQWNSKGRPPISLSFELPMFTASGLSVKYLKIYEKSGYKAVKWIRYLTKAGIYNRRI